jgi:HEAT repeat protein
MMTILPSRPRTPHPRSPRTLRISRFPRVARRSLNPRIICLTLTGSLVLAPLAGCTKSGGAGGQSKRQVRLSQPPKPPPSVPPRVDVPVDQGLRDLAWQELSLAKGSSNPLIRAHALEGMKDSVGANGADPIISGLYDEAAVVRFAAAMASGELKLQGARKPLLALVDDVDASVRVGARFGLHRLGDVSRSHDLEITAKDPLPRTRSDTALALGLMGEASAVNILIPMLADPDPAVRLQVAEALWRLGREDGLERLVSYSVSGHADEQMIALLALAAPRDRRVLGHITGNLTSDYEEVALVAARAAGMLGSDAGYGVAMKGYKSKDPRQRMLAALAFGSIGRPDAQDELAQLLRDPEHDVRIGAATALLMMR